MSELLPCPFCGEKPKHKIYIDACISISCMNCGIGFGYFGEKEESNKEAIEKWNHRHYPPEVQQAVERMKPKKVTYDDSSLGKPGVPEFWIAQCPECKQPMDFNDTPFEFCRRCGQALDWSE